MQDLNVNEVPKTLNQYIMSKANIVFLLGYEDITDSANLVEYINNHMPRKGIFISQMSIYKEAPNNPYDFAKERKK